MAISCGANALLREYANPFEVVKLGLDGLEEFLRSHHQGSLAPELTRKIFNAYQYASQLYGKLRENGQIPFDYEQIQREVRRKLEAIEYRREQMKQIEKELAPKAKDGVIIRCLSASCVYSIIPLLLARLSLYQSPDIIIGTSAGFGLLVRVG